MHHRYALHAARLACFTSIALSSALASAQTAAPKHCVTVARDPDEAVRAIAVRLEGLLARTPGVRSVADELTRAALRGESTSDPSLAALVTLRRQQALTDADSAPLGAMSAALGCTYVTQIAASPSGFVLRRFDAIARTFDAPTDAPSWSDDALRARLAIAPPPANGADAGANTATTVAATANTNTSSGTSRVATQPAAAQPSTSATRSTTAANSRPDPRVTTTQPDPVRSQGNRATPVWAWVVAGVAGAALVGGFIAAQSIGPSVPLVRVSGPGSAP